MKKNSINTKNIGFTLIFLMALSCQKNQELPQQFLPANSASSIQVKTIIDTLHVTDSLWVQETHSYGAAGAVWQVGGDYYSDLTRFVGERQVIEVLVHVNGAVETVGNEYTLPYQDGFLKWNGSTLYFQGPYGQFSFRSVEIEIVTKD